MQNVLINYKLVGGGDKSRLQSLINLYNLNDQVEIVGPLPHGKIFSFLDEIDIYIQPSKQEGLPRSVIEAMSRGCPVLGAKTGGIPELIPNDRIFKKGDVKQICRHIIRISLRKNMCCDAKINFNTAIHFSIENLDSKRRYFYNQFLKYYGMI